MHRTLTTAASPRPTTSSNRARATGPAGSPALARRCAVGVVALVPLLLGALTTPAGAVGNEADTGDVVVTNTETVSAKLDATGKLREARIYEQIALTGTGSTQIVNPVSTKNLRNLDGFAALDVSDGNLVTTVSVDGERRLRSVSDFDKDLPLGVEVTYLLDGKEVAPGKVVGKSGTLEVRYTVTNLTSREQDVTYDDGTGTQVTSPAVTVIPMIGQLVTILPPSFTAVTSGEASLAGDGHGGTRMTFQMTLFPPIGSPTAEFGYTAQVSGAVVPPATITALPVSPLASPSFKGGSASYKAGAESGVALTAGAIEIDANLLKLRDGAAQLLDGLVQLRAGADELSAGLNDDAVPGADQLAAGAGAAKAGADKVAAGALSAQTGAGQLSAGALAAQSGAGQLAAGALAAQTGAGQLAAGSDLLTNGLTQASGKAPSLLSGLTQVDAGLAKVDAGLAQLAGSIATVPAQADPLHVGIAKMRTAISGRLLPGLTSVHDGLTVAVQGSGTIAAGVAGVSTQVECAADKLTELSKGSGAATGCHAAAGTLPEPDPVRAAALEGVITELRTSQLTLANPAAGAASLNASLTGMQGSLGTLKAGSQSLLCGISVASSPLCPTTDAAGAPVLGLLEGINQVDGGITQLVTGVVGGVQQAVGSATDTAAQGTLRGGIHSVQGGTGQIAAGGQTLVAGLGELGAGASALRDGAGRLVTGTGQLATGAGTLATGAGQLATGAGALATGTGQLATGAGTLAAGNGKIAAGATELANGLGDAADGSALIADGLGQAADSAPALVDGAQQLSDEGTSQLVVSGGKTASDYGVKYAVIAAGADRAVDEGMAYGAPEGAAGATAYSIDIAGVDGDGKNSAGRGLAALALFAGGAGLAGLVRRRLS
ncbi:hypothetical protein [Pengzhenrongella frigida]|uniref:hypothetical protein n=1 Tax=Pengzhenrongella frigida TaxID=1259133 RepID=UPI001F5D1506|nr:hypothetical protein [Cellulomonas sp. HLT2-17]